MILPDKFSIEIFVWPHSHNINIQIEWHAFLFVLKPTEEDVSVFAQNVLYVQVARASSSTWQYMTLCPVFLKVF